MASQVLCPAVHGGRVPDGNRSEHSNSPRHPRIQQTATKSSDQLPILVGQCGQMPPWTMMKDVLNWLGFWVNSPPTLAKEQSSCVNIIGWSSHTCIE
eukprot:6474094-Amphidinium_carterae.1